MIFSLIQPCGIFADIGSDHGYLALEVLKSGRAKYVIATDIRTGPLKHAQKTFAQANVFENVSYVLSDGIRSITESIDCVVISGLGADVILNIIQQDLERFKTIPQIIVQANTKLSALRIGLAQLGFQIREEKIVCDGFYYLAQKIVYAGLYAEISEDEAHYGKLIDSQDPVYRAYLQSELTKISAILKQYPHSEKHKIQIALLKTRLDERVD